MERFEFWLIAAIAVIWLALAALYLTVPALYMPSGARVWGLGGLFFLALATLIGFADAWGRRRTR